MKAATTRLNDARKKVKETLFMLKVRQGENWDEEEARLRRCIIELEDVMMKFGEKDVRRLNLDRLPRKYNVSEREDFVEKMISRKHTSRTITTKTRKKQG